MINRQDTIKLISMKMKEYAPTSKTILYGSSARGDAGKDSDIDLLVILDEDVLTPDMEFGIVQHLYPLEVESGIIINSVVTTKQRWEKRPFQTPFYVNVMNEGIII